MSSKEEFKVGLFLGFWENPGLHFILCCSPIFWAQFSARCLMVAEWFWDCSHVWWEENEAQPLSINANIANYLCVLFGLLHLLLIYTILCFIYFRLHFNLKTLLLNMLIYPAFTFFSLLLQLPSGNNFMRWVDYVRDARVYNLCTLCYYHAYLVITCIGL